MFKVKRRQGKFSVSLDQSHLTRLIMECASAGVVVGNRETRRWWDKSSGSESRGSCESRRRETGRSETC